MVLLLLILLIASAQSFTMNLMARKLNNNMYMSSIPKTMNEYTAKGVGKVIIASSIFGMPLIVHAKNENENSSKKNKKFENCMSKVSS